MTLGEALAGGIDCAVITTAHAQIDYAEIARRVPVVVDTRNAIARAGLTPRHGQVVKA